MRPHALLSVVALLGMLGCTSAEGSGAGAPSSPPPAASTGAAAQATAPRPTVERPSAATLPVPAAPAAPSTAPSTSPPTAVAAPTTTMPPATVPNTTTTTPAATDPAVGLGAVGLATDAVQVLEIGRSREGRPIMAVQRGTPGGVPVLVIGVIHGNEDAGVAIIERLATAPVPEGVDLWLVESMNPDGQVAGRRGNAALVDLNRNFPHRWGPIGQPGDSQYAGTGPASEPETQAVVAFVSQIRPALGIWYHQDLFRLSPGDGFEGELKARYAEMTGLPILGITGGIYTGVAATWQRNAVDGISFIVELGPTLSAEEADTHTAAVVELTEMLRSRR